MSPVLELVASDIPLLGSFFLEAWRLAGPSALGWTGGSDEDIKEIASEHHLRGFIGNPNLRVFISKAEENVNGFCALRKMDSQSIELAGIIVRQDQLGKGIGTELFEVAKKKAIATGYTTMIVKTESINDKALSFYRGKGFTEEEQAVEEVSGVRVNLTILKLNLQEKDRS